MSDLHRLDEHITGNWGEDSISDDDDPNSSTAPHQQVAGWSHLAGDIRHTWHWFNMGESRALCGYQPDSRWLTMRQPLMRTAWAVYACRHCQKRLAKQQA